MAKKYARLRLCLLNAAEPMIAKTLTLTYSPDALLNRFATLAHRPWAMLLTSGQADHADNRFDILTADPRITLTTRGGYTETDDGTGIQRSGEDPLQLLQRQIDRLGSIKPCPQVQA